MKPLAFLAALLLGLAAGQPIPAATIETEASPEMHEMGCTLRLRGEIVPGDLDRLRTRLARNFGEGVGPDHPEFGDVVFRNLSPATDYGDFFFTHRLCLDSPGGDFAEAIAIVDFMREETRRVLGGVPTAIARGDRCEGACAFVFLAGRFQRFTDNIDYDNRPNAMLHPEGRLGLQAPFSPGAPDTSRLAAIAERMANGSLFLTPSLFARMLNNPPPDMAHIATVGDALDGRIEVEPTLISYGLYGLDRETFLGALCRNAALLAPASMDIAGPAVPSFTAEGEWAVVSGPEFRDRFSGRPYRCALDTSQWNMFRQGLEVSADAQATDSPERPLIRQRYAGTDFIVTFRPAVECFQCEVKVIVPTIAAFPPDLPLSRLSPPGP